MNTKKHFVLFTIAVSAWLLFYLIGYPFNYFLDWKLESQILLTLLTVFAILPLIGTIFLIYFPGNYIKSMVWLAFYGSVPLFILDLLFIGFLRNEGLHYLYTHWYLTAGYIYVWIVFPIIGYSFKKLIVQLQKV
ncbi:MAG: hypothetical protein K8R67_07225 [Desulfobacteraceae bacterium]|nr:hypothetical protein [Desulfobacteraceae bacterium]